MLCFHEFSPKVGLSRAGCVSACMFKEFQISSSFEGLIETVPGVDLSLLKMDRFTMNAAKYALFRGEFAVNKELLTSLGADGEAFKRECDQFIDKNGPAKTGGTGIKQLRGLSSSTILWMTPSLSRPRISLSAPAAR